MKIKNQYVIIISTLIIIAALLPDFWQITMMTVLGFFLAYLLTKINNQR